MADKLGCRSKKNLPWSESEMEIIRSHYSQGMEAEALTQLLHGRSVSAIFLRAEAMGVLSGRFWREDELQILKKQYPVVGTEVIQQLPGRNEVSILIMARLLRLKKSRESLTGFRPCSDEEWMLLEKNMHLSVAEQQATLFPDRSNRAVEKRVGVLSAKKQIWGTVDDIIARQSLRTTRFRNLSLGDIETISVWFQKASVVKLRVRENVTSSISIIVLLLSSTRRF
ncbi:hypothetical protein [Citrobacter koseri]|uniref:hypothetical protein n=1 Tax=Citrobacter koseri TaxID=545 RepID=UPI001F4878D0|nr:hypothetical protein [Citrobacter koseri]